MVLEPETSHCLKCFGVKVHINFDTVSEFLWRFTELSLTLCCFNWAKAWLMAWNADL